MRSIETMLADGYRVLATPARSGGRTGLRAQVIPSTRSRLEPLVLNECRHAHQGEAAAIACGEAWARGRLRD